MVRRLKFIAACGAFLLFVGALTLWLDPFAPRFEGRTVSQWISVSVKDRSRLDEHLVSGFGGAAAPQLLATVGRMHSASRAIHKISSEQIASFAMRKLDYRQRQLVVSEWLALLHFLGEPVLPLACELRDYSSVMLILSHVDEDTLTIYRQQTTNTFLRQNAEHEHSGRWSSGVLRGSNPYPNFEQNLKRIKQRRAANP